MSWKAVLLAGFFLLGVALGYNDQDVFQTHITKCYAEKYISGETSLENFLFLLQKIEKSNEGLPLEEFVGMLLKRFVVEGVTVFSDAIGMNDNYLKVDKITHFLLKDSTRQFPEEELDVQEKCTLHYLLSYTVDRSFRNGIDNENYKAMRSDVAIVKGKPRSVPQYVATRPREKGVVSLHSNKIHAFALGRVLIGIYAGLQNSNPKRVTDLLKELTNVQQENDYSNEILDPVYALTLADILVFLRIREKNKTHTLGPNGEWGPRECRPEYGMTDNERRVSYSLLRGAIDGLILGLNIKQTMADHGDNMKLSQLLRMYYSSSGIPSSQVESLSYCKRKQHLDDEKLKELTKQLFDYGLVYRRVAFHYSTDETIRQFAEQTTNELKNSYEQLFLEHNAGLDEECKKGSDDSEALIDTPGDLIFVLDTSEEGIGRQDVQLKLVLDVIKDIDFSMNRSTLTVLTKNLDSSTNFLQTIVNRSSCISEIRCSIEELDDRGFNASEGVGLQEDKNVIRMLMKLLKNIKQTYGVKGGRPRQTVVYFSYLENPIKDSGFTKTMKEFHKDYSDVTIYAVGKEEKVLMQFVDKETLDVISEPSDDELKNILRRKLGEAPAVLNYEYCKKDDGDAESRKYKSSVLPNHVQHITMYPKSFHTSKDLKIWVETKEGGHVKVCTTRDATVATETESGCLSTSEEKPKIEFPIPTPCKGLKVENCSPIKFSVIGEPGEVKSTCTDELCRRPDEIKFKIEFSGARCCPDKATGLLPPTLQMLILLSSFIFYLLNRQKL